MVFVLKYFFHLLYTFFIIKIEVPKANKPSFVSKNDTLDSEQVLIEKVMQLSMKLPDEVQNFIDKLKPISEDCSDFLLYLFKHQHINYGKHCFSYWVKFNI